MHAKIVIMDTLFKKHRILISQTNTDMGEPDEKGRRAPVGTGKFETLKVNTVVAEFLFHKSVHSFGCKVNHFLTN